jgi:hypothetical protein
MEKESIQIKKEENREASGKMANEFNGRTNKNQSTNQLLKKTNVIMMTTLKIRVIKIELFFH